MQHNRTTQQSSLPIDHAFVVQFRSHTDPVKQHFAGRIEQICSGLSTTFDSVEALLAFITQTLTPGPAAHSSPLQRKEHLMHTPTATH